MGWGDCPPCSGGGLARRPRPRYPLGETTKLQPGAEPREPTARTRRGRRGCAIQIRRNDRADSGERAGAVPPPQR